MAKAQRLNLDQIRDAFRLVNEICDCGENPSAWRIYFVQQLMQRLHARAGFSQEECLLADCPQIRGAVHVGIDPSRIDQLTTTFDVTIYSREAIPNSGWVHLCAIFRNATDPPFSSRDRSYVKLVHEELARVWNRPQIPDPIDKLAPRAQAMIQLFRLGLSEKQVACELGLSTQTIHTYVRDLYRRIGVNTRFELLERFKPTRRSRPRFSFGSRYVHTPDDLQAREAVGTVLESV